MLRIALVGVFGMSLVGLVPCFASTVTVPEGETLTLSTGTEIAESDDLALFGTLDLNGHSVAVRSMTTRHAEALQETGVRVASSAAQITNSAAGSAVLTLTSGVSTYTGRVAPGVQIVCDRSASLKLATPQRGFAANRLSISGSVSVLSRPTRMIFVFKDVAADGSSAEKLVRLSEVVPTCGGVPVTALGGVVTCSDGGLVDGRIIDNVYLGGKVSVSTRPCVITLTLSGVDGQSPLPVDGYRIGTASEPAYSPTEWDVYIDWNDEIGAVLVDRHVNDPLNRPSISTATTSDTWSNQLSQNFAFSRDAIGSPFGLSTDVSLASGASLRASTAEQLSAGTVSGSGKIVLDGRLAAGEGILSAAEDAQAITTRVAAGADATSVESGTLRIRGKLSSSWTCSVIKIAPKKVPASDGASVFWGMNEFKIYDENGAEVSLAKADVDCSTKTWNTSSTSGYTLVDGKESTRMLPKNGSVDDLPFVTITPKAPVTFASYDWYPSVNNGTATANRFPTELEIWVSSDGESWELADHAFVPQPADNAGYCTYQGGANHFAAKGGEVAEPQALPDDIRGSLSASSAFVESVKARYFRFAPHATFYDANFTDTSCYGWALSEFALLRNGEIVEWPTNNANFSVSNFGCSAGNSSTTAFFADNVRNGATGGAGQHRIFIKQLYGHVQVDAGEALEFDAYELFAGTPSGYTQRTPRGWTLSVSADGETWHVIDVHRPAEDDVFPPNPYDAYGPFSLKNRWSTFDVGNAIGDKSTVSIASGATLSVGGNDGVVTRSANERVGGLDGAGTVALVDGSILDLAVGDSTPVFSGSVAGNGTLVVSGPGAQDFNGADLSGVGKLVLERGFMTGSASFGLGDLALDFSDGVLGAELSGVGTLTVSGKAKFLVPESAVDQRAFTQTFVTAGLIPDASQGILRAGTIMFPEGVDARDWVCKLAVDSNSVVLQASKRGLMVIVR